MSLAVLLAQHNEVTVLDVDSSKVDRVNKRLSTIDDAEIEKFLAEEMLCLLATLDSHKAYMGAKFVIVATPTNYDPDTNYFDTTSVDEVVKDALVAKPDALIVIKSTLPLQATLAPTRKYETDRIIFSPEFLRRGQRIEG